MGWRVIHISESEKISLFLDNLKVETKGEPILVPLKDIHSLILDNYKMVASVQLLCRCCENNINVVVCGVDHNPKAIVMSHTGHHQTASILKKQISWDESMKGFIHQQIVKQKILNQIIVLRKVGVDQVEKLVGYLEDVQRFDTTNREGHAAKVYFRLLFGQSFIRFEDDVINAGLNYGYSILRSQINKTLVAKGLNTSLGIIHKGPYNAFNLSDDIIEPFRPIVDLWVYTNLRDSNKFSRDHRQELIKLTTSKIMVNQQKHTVFNAVTMFSSSIINFFDDDTTKLLMPTIL